MRLTKKNLEHILIKLLIPKSKKNLITEAFIIESIERNNIFDINTLIRQAIVNMYINNDNSLSDSEDAVLRKAANSYICNGRIDYVEE